MSEPAKVPDPDAQAFDELTQRVELLGAQIRVLLDARLSKKRASLAAVNFRSWRQLKRPQFDKPPNLSVPRPSQAKSIA